MPKKRTSDESCSNAAEEQTNNNAAADVLQDEDNAKRAKLTPFMSDTTLQDLPLEIIECILIQVVAMEVKSMKLARSVWKEKAEPVINRLSDVCWQWSSVLSAVVFRNRLQRALEGHGTIRLKILQQHTIPFNRGFSTVTALRDEVFLHYRLHGQEDDYINVYDCNNVAEVTHVIPLPGFNTERIVACTVSNCVYILNRKQRDHFSIFRITGDSDPRWSTVSEVIGDINLPECNFCVAANGSLIFSRKQSIRIPAISVYDANGSLQQTIRLSTDINEKIRAMISKPNGNLVLIGSHELPFYDQEHADDDIVVVDINDYGGDDDNDDDDDDNDDDNDDNDDIDFDFFDDDDDWQVLLTEIDMNGTKISKYPIPLGKLGYQDIHSSIVDSDGRMMALSAKNRMQLFDSDFNRMDFTGDQLIGPEPSIFTFVKFHHNSERNETIMIDEDWSMGQARFTAFRLEEL